MELKKNFKYALACPTSMGVRITPANRMAVHNSNMFYLQATAFPCFRRWKTLTCA